MARLARSRSWTETAPANGLHHVTNRSVGRVPLFRSPLDRLVFLSLLAAFCLDDGLRIHCFCLMTNHFHLLVEDPRGTLSRLMLRLETAYARYHRDSAGRRGDGHVFGDRFFSRRIGTSKYYRAVVEYILLNPLRCAEPLADTAEGYLWSSASMHIGERSAAVGFSALVDSFGGVDGVLESLPRAGTARLLKARRERFDCLVGGEWFDSEIARQGRSGVELSGDLIVKAGETELEFEDLEPRAACPDGIPMTQPPFAGRPKQDVLGALKMISVKLVHQAELKAYVLWRFATESHRRIQRSRGKRSRHILESIEWVRAARQRDRTMNEFMTRLEWRMTAVLSAGPWRV